MVLVESSTIFHLGRGISQPPPIATATVALTLGLLDTWARKRGVVASHTNRTSRSSTPHHRSRQGFRPHPGPPVGLDSTGFSSLLRSAGRPSRGSRAVATPEAHRTLAPRRQSTRLMACPSPGRIPFCLVNSNTSIVNVISHLRASPCFDKGLTCSVLRPLQWSSMEEYFLAAVQSLNKNARCCYTRMILPDVWPRRLGGYHQNGGTEVV